MHVRRFVIIYQLSITLLFLLLVSRFRFFSFTMFFHCNHYYFYYYLSYGSSWTELNTFDLTFVLIWFYFYE